MTYMDAPYWVADYLIDPSRNQVTRSKQTYIVQPKVLAVLNLLAKHAGQVVSHDELMSTVWPNAYVGPNTLQRCIAELRKMLGDDSKTQAIIKTHSKLGYSLEVAVKPDEQLETPSSNSGAPKHQFAIAFSLMIVLCIVIMVWMHPDKTQNITFDNIRPITATDEKEYYPDYSPDGKYMVFHRYLGVCENHLWAKDLTNQREVRLTKSSAVYGQHSWSVDGTQLAFTVQQDCYQNQTEKALCWQLHTLDFAAAIQSPQTTVKRLNCEKRKTSQPRWLADGSILMLEHAGNNKITRYHPATDQLTDFYLSKDKQLVHFDVSDDAAQIAIFEQDSLLNNSLSILDSKANLLSSAQVNLPEHLSVFQRFEPDFSADGERFLFNTGQGLFSLSYEGETSPIEYLGHQRLHTPKMHPSGNKLLATQGQVDADIAMLSTQAIRHPLQVAQPSSFARSNGYDASAKFQPNGEHIAFLSRRTGSSQLWLAKGEEISQLSDFEHRSQVSSVVWSPDSKALATVANDQIWILSLKGSQQSIPLDFPVRGIFQWVNDNTLLIEANHTSANQVVLLDLAKRSVKNTGKEDAHFAYLLDDNKLLFIDALRQPYLIEGSVEKPIIELRGQMDSKRFFVKKNKLFGINWQNQLWAFDLAENQLDIVSTLHPDVWWVSDKKDHEILFTILVSTPKEIIELSRQKQ